MFIKIREGFILNKVMSLHDAVAKYVENGDTLAIGGFTTNRKPYATVSEILRQGQKDFIVYAGPGGGEVDMLIGEGRVAAYINCYTANSGYTNVSRRFRAAIEQGKLTYEDYSQDVLMLMLHASSLGLPFLPVRLMQGSGLMKFWGISEEKRKTMPKIEDLKCAEIENPMVPGQKVVAVPVPKIDTAIIHVQQASPDGTCIIMRRRVPRYRHCDRCAQDHRHLRGDRLRRVHPPRPDQDPYLRRVRAGGRQGPLWRMALSVLCLL